MTNKQKLIHHLQNHPACKDLKELSFGCEIKPFNNLQRFHAVYFVEYDEETLTHIENGKIGKSKCSLGDFTIIGHPPTLRHLLLVLKEKSIIVQLHENQHIHIPVYGYQQQSTVTLDLTKPLDQQEPEVYEGLVELLEKIKG